MRVLQLYVHLPFCLHKCPYCDFNSHVGKQIDWHAWAQAFVHELAKVAERHRLTGSRLASIFFGGGTPSLAPAFVIERVIDEAARLFSCDASIEITLEANPGASDAARFFEYRLAGVNRLSLGVQSFDDRELAFLGRVHTANEARAAIAAARQAGFDNINLDLIYALAEQTLAQWRKSLEEAIAHAPRHLSCYQLTIEPGTAFFARRVRSADEPTAVEMFCWTRARLAEAGWPAYEVSNHAQPGWHCRHNDGYWRYQDYIGLGPGAASKLDMANGGVLRWSNLRAPERYLRAVAQDDAPHAEIAPAACECERLTSAQAAREAIWLGLRRSNGVPAKAFSDRFGSTPAALVQEALANWIAQGVLCVQADGGLCLSQQSVLVLDSVAADLLSLPDACMEDAFASPVADF